VSATGALSTSGTVSGTVSAIPAAPKTPFSFPSASFTDGAVTIQFGATNATVAFTGFRVANQSSVPTTLTIYQYAEPSASCSTSPASSRFLGQFSVPAGETVDEQRATTYGGYVVSGTFSPATTGGPTAPQLAPATVLRGETRAQAAAR
jgi:hypothetical protein